MPAPEKSYPANYNALHDPGFRVSRGAPPVTRAARPETPGVQRLADAGMDLAVEYDEVTQMPIRVENRQAQPRLSARFEALPLGEAATDWIKEHRDLWRLSEADAETVEVISTSTKGLPAVRLQQRVGGVEVFNSEITAAVSGDNELVALSGQLFHGAGEASSERHAVAAVSPGQAIAKAASDCTGLPYEAADFAPSAAEVAEDDSYRYYDYVGAEDNERPGFERPVRLKDVLFPTGTGEFLAGYYLELWIRGHPAFAYVLDTEDVPDVLFRKNLTSGAFSYRVHNHGAPTFRPHDGPAPGTPHPSGIPNGFQAPTIPEVLVTLDSILPGDPWLPEGATRTEGNNCFAYADLQRPDGFGQGDVEGKTSAPGEFDYTYDHTQDSTVPDNLQASIVGMFFHVNWLHDKWYEAGFDEASGNAQRNNFGRGGSANDPIRAEGSDFGGTDNANMSTPADGSSPRMQMFTFTGTNPTRTSNHEALITFHEMGHYITNRLVGNSRGLGNQQGSAMGEGWGDFFAVCMTSQPTDDFATGVFATGGWTDLTPSFRENYYFSIRRYPYSADMTKNPLTFKHISDNVMLPVGPPRLPSSTPNSEEHNAGEVWCSMLWEVFVSLIAKHGHEEAEKRMLQYVIGGLKLTAPNPTFIHARNGIITAVTTLDPGDLPEVRAGFAKRGMGRNAVGPSANSTNLTGVVEDFTP
jgi:extracellular elastinolytic metalloproteinase